MPPTPSDADARFDRTIDRWFRDRLRLEPELATYLGVHDHDHELSVASREAIEERVAALRATIDELSRFDGGELSSDRGLDRDLVVHEARLRIHELTERRSWAGRSGAAEDIGDALFPLFTRDFAPLPERLESITARLDEAPRYLADTRTRVTSSPSASRSFVSSVPNRPWPATTHRPRGGGTGRSMSRMTWCRVRWGGCQIFAFTSSFLALSFISCRPTLPRRRSTSGYLRLWIFRLQAATWPPIKRWLLTWLRRFVVFAGPLTFGFSSRMIYNVSSSPLTAPKLPASV